MAKKMTLERRAEKAALAETGGVHGTYRGLAFADGFKAGWRARGRAGAATKAERAVIEAAIKAYKVRTVAIFREVDAAVAALLKARSAK
jgi:hypothetical protein